MDFDELERLQAGEDGKGNAKFRIPLKPDDQGMVGRECTNEKCDPKYFKISLLVPEESTDDLSQAELVCPYCGTRMHIQEANTQEQLGWIKDLMFRDVARQFDEMMSEAFSDVGNVTYRAGRLPDVKSYVEEELRQSIKCDCCGRGYAVYGVTFHCPFCGTGAFGQHLEQGARTIGVLADEADRIGGVHGTQVRDKMYGNAYEDIVSMFEGLLKNLYRYCVRKRYSEADAERMLGKVKVNFQRLNGAEEFFRRDLDLRLFDSTSDAERASLELVFAKRHLLTHNLGLVDEKYQGQVRSWQRQGAEVSLEKSEIIYSLSLVKKILSSAAKGAGL